jgi:hypothetical protein
LKIPKRIALSFQVLSSPCPYFYSANIIIRGWGKRERGTSLTPQLERYCHIAFSLINMLNVVNPKRYTIYPSHISFRNPEQIKYSSILKSLAVNNYPSFAAQRE